MAEIEEKEHEHKSSGIAKAGLVTGIVGTTLGAMGAAGGTGILGALTGNGNKQAEQIASLRDENIMLKSAALTNEKTNELNVRLVRQEEQIKSMRVEFGQALQMETVQRQNGDVNLRQYVDDNFVHAKKCVAAQDITPAVGLWPFGTPSFAQPAVAPFPPFGYPFPPFAPVPPIPPASGAVSGTSSSSPDVTNG